MMIRIPLQKSYDQEQVVDSKIDRRKRMEGFFGYWAVAQQFAWYQHVVPTYAEIDLIHPDTLVYCIDGFSTPSVHHVSYHPSKGKSRAIFTLNKSHHPLFYILRGIRT
ncbi:MAG: hypothetical protein ABIK83_01960 [Candidatus Zixiibacteriota bacterium]